MDRLYRDLAPIPDAAWIEIEKTARHVLETNLGARHYVDVVGPRGPDYAAVDLGRLEDEANVREGVQWGVRRVQPLVEVRIPFALPRTEIDALSRGADDVDLDPLVLAARQAAAFEDDAVFNGLPDASIQGLREVVRHPPLPLGEDPLHYPEVVTLGIMRMRDVGVEGPYRLILGPAAYRALGRDTGGVPVRDQLARLLEAPPYYSPALEGGVLLSVRGGDFELTLGRDMSVGYERADRDLVHLYLTESFTFRPHGEEAAVSLPFAA